MALFNKLFSNRKGVHNRHQDNASEKTFAFSKDQVRVVLFRECDFRGRKLLFDSKSVQKIPLHREHTKTPETEQFSEITNGFGYLYGKPEADFSQLGEMVFGSVAMSYRGTYFKMHFLESPTRLMFSQVFSSPRVSVSSRSEHSRFDDSGASSTNSFSESSVYSTASDTILVCRRPQSMPLDVPKGGSIPSLIDDSGYGTGHSFTNHIWGSIYGAASSSKSLSSSSLYRRWLRNSSLENSGSSLANSDCQEGDSKHRRSKLGLTFILQLTPGQETDLSQFFMEHICLIEVLLRRAHQLVETAFIKCQNFTSLMMEMVDSSAQFLVNLLSGSHLPVNLWLTLSNGCDNFNSISAFSERTKSEPQLFDFNASLENEIGDFNLFSFTKLLRADRRENNFVTAGKFMQDLCELLENIDVKNTNFFMSTLLTAVLTYHLGWVNTCLPPAKEPLEPKHPFNPLWGEIGDLYGAVGHPTKMAQTIVTGTNKKDLVSRILLTMTYFIRCCEVDRRVPIRSATAEENKIAEHICREYSGIPKENYKKYEDHLKEIMNSNRDFIMQPKTKPEEVKTLKKSTGLTKTLTVTSNLAKLNEDFTNCTIEETEECTPMFFEHVENNNVVFVLGEDEQLVGIKKPNKPIVKRKTSQVAKPNFKDEDFHENLNKTTLKPSTSWCSRENGTPSVRKLSRCQSEPPEERKFEESSKSKYRYSGVKLNLQQYPQILSNYMKSKNVEISNLSLGDKSMKLDELSALSDTISCKYPDVDEDYENGEALQTPSNASELEFTSDLFVLPPLVKPNEGSTRPKNCDELKTESRRLNHKMKVINLPMPKSSFFKSSVNTIKYTTSLMRGVSESYLPHMVLQGPVIPKHEWESSLRKDLALTSQYSLIDQSVEEAVAVIANTDTWEVQLVSSHTFFIDKGSSGIRIGMSQLISNMLESLLQMWKLKVPAHYCLMHIEQTLQELCVRSKALSEFLLSTEFCNMEQLTSTLQLEANDVPLLMAVASTHSPQVTQKYGLSFQ